MTVDEGRRLNNPVCDSGGGGHTEGGLANVASRPECRLSTTRNLHAWPGQGKPKGSWSIID
jgi:hypothetical protein